MRVLTLSLVSLVTFIIFASQLHATVTEVFLVNDTTDEVQRITWNHHLTLYDVLLKRNVVSGFTDRMYYVSGTFVQKYKKFDPATLKAVILKPGDLVIFGPLGSEREEKLKAVPELGAILKTLPSGERP